MDRFSSPIKILLSFVLLILFAMGCKLLHPGSSGNSNVVGTAGEPTSAASGDPRQNLGAALTKLKTAFPYRLTETSSATYNNQTVQTTRVSEFEAADRIHSKITSGDRGGVEMVTVGDKTYTNLGSGWVEGASKSAAEKQSMAAKMEQLLASSIKEVNSAGSETVNGTPCFIYAYRLDMDIGGKPYSGTGKAWVGTKDGLPHQTDGEFKTGTYAWKYHIVYEYGVNVKVTKPM